MSDSERKEVEFKMYSYEFRSVYNNEFIQIGKHN